MPWSSPCKCPAHITYGRAIGIETLWMIVKAGYRISHQCMDIQFQRKPYSFVHNKSTGTLICFLRKKNPMGYFYCIQTKNVFQMIVYTFTDE